MEGLETCSHLVRYDGICNESVKAPKVNLMIVWILGNVRYTFIKLKLQNCVVYGDSKPLQLTHYIALHIH